MTQGAMYTTTSSLRQSAPLTLDNQGYSQESAAQASHVGKYLGTNQKTAKVAACVIHAGNSPRPH